MTSNATRPTKTKAGGPHHCNQLKNLQEDHAALQNRHAELQKSFIDITSGSALEELQENYAGLRKKNTALQATFAQGLSDMDKLTREVAHLKGELKEAEHQNSQLGIEACMSMSNRRDMLKCRKQRNIMIAIAVVQMVMICIMGAR